MMNRTLNEFFGMPARLMHMSHWLVLVIALSFAAVDRLSAANAYDVAVRIFNDRAYDLAEKEFAEFVKNNPNSDKVPDAILYQAQSRFQLRQYVQAEALLRERLGAAGKLADEYHYWIAECLFQRGSDAEAATLFSRVVSEFPNSPHRLSATLGEAFSRFRLGELGQVVHLLTQTNGVFQQSAPSRLDDEPIVRGYLLLGEAYLRLKEFRAGEEALSRLSDASLRPDLAWEKKYLLTRLQRADQRRDVALQTVTELLAQLVSVTNALSAKMHADAVALQGEILEEKKQPDAAVQAYEKNLLPGVAPERRQQAVKQIVQLTLAQNKVSEAGRRLEAFVTQNPADPMLDLLRLTLGELRLKEYYELPEGTQTTATNLLRLAQSHFDQVLTRSNSQFAAKAHFGRGWCLWQQGQSISNYLADSLAAFEAAAEKLPRTEEQAVARFKLADCQFALGNYAGAITDYWLVVTNYADLPRVKSELGGQSLYQIARAGIQGGDLAPARQAVEQILSGYPEGVFTDRIVLLFGQAENRLGRPEEARALFASLLKSSPESSLVPEVELAIARTYEQEGNWVEATRQYNQWVGRHTNHLARARAEFDRAWAHDRSGDETNAFALFTNFVAEFATNALAPLAQYWVADYFYHLGGTNYVKAEENYQKVFQNTNWPVTDLSFEARMMAGRAAYFRQGYNDAIGYFRNVITNAPASLLPEAYFALADAFIRFPEAVGGGPVNTLTNYTEAIIALDKIVQSYSTNRLAPLAWGQMGLCYLQLAAVDPKQYDRALNAYTNALTNNLADVEARSIAMTGIATTLQKQAEEASESEKTALLNEALHHYLYVVNGRILRDGEEADPYWVKKAAEAAARLAEEQHRWEVAANLYRRLMEIAPPLRKMWELKLQKIEQARPQLESPGK